MSYIAFPNLPEKEVSVFIADTSIENKIVITPPSLDILPAGLRRHADLGICIVSKDTAVCPPDSFLYYKEMLSPYGFTVLQGNSSLQCNYPGDCAYNVGIVGKKCFLNKSVCDSLLYDILTSEGYEIINVKQGYCKCSICPIDENTLITGDKSIEKAALSAGMEVFFVRNEGIFLENYNNGFFGGCCGMADSKTLLVNGNINTFPDRKILTEFLNRKGINIKSVKKGVLTDIGSILPLIC